MCLDNYVDVCGCLFGIVCGVGGCESVIYVEFWLWM